MVINISYESWFYIIFAGITIIYWLIIFRLHRHLKKRYDSDGFEILATYLIATGLFVFITVFYLNRAYTYVRTDGWGNIGAIGDLIGGTTVAFFTLASLILLVGTLRIQKREMKITNSKMHIQQIEQTYFNVLESFIHTKNQMKVSKLNEDHEISLIHEGEDIFNAAWLKHELQYYGLDNTKLLSNTNQLNIVQYFNLKVHYYIIGHNLFGIFSKFVGEKKLYSWYDVIIVINHKKDILNILKHIHLNWNILFSNDWILLKDFYNKWLHNGTKDYKKSSSEVVEYIYSSLYKKYSTDVEKVERLTDIIVHISAQQKDIDGAIGIFESIHYEIPSFLFDNEFVEPLLSRNNFAHITSSTKIEIIFQFYEEFIWLVKYIVRNLKDDQQREDQKIYLEHLKLKIDTEELITVYILQMIYLDNLVKKTFETLQDEEIDTLVSELEALYSTLDVGYNGENENHILDNAICSGYGLSPEVINIEDLELKKKQFDETLHKYKDHLKFLSIKIYEEIKEDLSILAILIENSFFIKLNKNTNLGFFNSDVVTANKLSEDLIATRLIKMKADIYEQFNESLQEFEI